MRVSSLAALVPRSQASAWEREKLNFVCYNIT